MWIGRNHVPIMLSSFDRIMMDERNLSRAMDWTDWMTVLHIGQRGLRRTLSMIRYREDSLYGEPSRISIRLSISKREINYRPSCVFAYYVVSKIGCKRETAAFDWTPFYLWQQNDRLITYLWIDQIDVSLISNISSNI